LFNALEPGANSSELPRLMDEVLTHAHRALDDLLREEGLPPHVSTDFGGCYETTA
jgi:hypothetical protein